jgi:hypothetical protein
MKAASALVEPSMKPPLKGLYITSTLVEARERVPVRIVNVADQDQVLSEGTVVGHVEPVVWTMPLGDQELPPPATQGACEQLQGVISDAMPNLDATETQALEGLIAEFRDVFATSSDDFGRTDRVRHRIDTGDARPIRQPPRRLPLAKQAEVDNMLDDMKRKGVIEESEGPWSSPVVLVRKKNGDLPFCVDCRKLNDVTKKDCCRYCQSNVTKCLGERSYPPLEQVKNEL